MKKERSKLGEKQILLYFTCTSVQEYQTTKCNALSMPVSFAFDNCVDIEPHEQGQSEDMH